MRRFRISERISTENAFYEMTIRACQLVKGTYMCTSAESATPKIHQLFNSNFLPSGNLRFPLLPAPCSGCRGGEMWVNHKGSALLLFLLSCYSLFRIEYTICILLVNLCDWKIYSTYISRVLKISWYIFL